MQKKLLLAAGSLLALASCNTKPQRWSLNGEMPADIEQVTLEIPSPAGGWYTADSVNVDASGRFSIARERANHEIYRLKVDNKYIYLPADSTETISLVLSPDGKYVIEGSHEATLFSEVNDILSQPFDSIQRRKLLVALQDDFASTAAYYANLRLNGADRTLLRAVANAYSTSRPDEPTTAVLLAQLKNVNKPSASGETIVLEAPELGYFDIELLNRKGEKIALSSVVDTHPVTLLAFVNMAAESAPAVNLNIGEAFTAFPQIGIYQVGFGKNQHQWADASEELPWINVFQSESASQAHLGQYALRQIPTFFIIKNGEIVERIEDPTKIKDSLRKHI